MEIAHLPYVAQTKRLNWTHGIQPCRPAKFPQAPANECAPRPMRDRLKPRLMTFSRSFPRAGESQSRRRNADPAPASYELLYQLDLSYQLCQAAECQFAAIAVSIDCCCCDVSADRLAGCAANPDIASTSCCTCAASREVPSLSSN